MHTYTKINQQIQIKSMNAIQQLLYSMYHCFQIDKSKI